MTRERRQDVAFAALVVSLAVHAGVMWFMRPQVMTRIPGDGARERRLPPMRIVDAVLHSTSTSSSSILSTSS